jgi:hypothetical protein
LKFDEFECCKVDFLTENRHEKSAQPENEKEVVEKKEEVAAPVVVEAETTEPEPEATEESAETKEETPAEEPEEKEEVKENGDVESLKRKSISTDDVEVKKKKVDEEDAPAAAVQEAEA